MSILMILFKVLPDSSGPVKVSFFGNLKLGRLNDPLQTKDKVLIVASLEDLLATKLKAILESLFWDQ